MLREHAQKLISLLDEIEADQRRLEGRVRRVRHQLQREFRIVMWDYDGSRDRTVEQPQSIEEVTR